MPTGRLPASVGLGRTCQHSNPTGITLHACHDQGKLGPVVPSHVQGHGGAPEKGWGCLSENSLVVQHALRMVPALTWHTRPGGASLGKWAGHKTRGTGRPAGQGGRVGQPSGAHYWVHSLLGVSVLCQPELRGTNSHGKVPMGCC